MATNGGASWFRRLFSRSATKALDPTRGDLVIVVSSFDDAESCSAALERGANETGFESGDEVVFRHHLLLPSDMVADAVAVAAQDGYEMVDEPVPAPGIPPTSPAPGVSPTSNAFVVADGVEVTLRRVQVLDALHCSQERSRMAGLAQRRGGVVSGWDALQPGPQIAD